MLKKIVCLLLMMMVLSGCSNTAAVKDTQNLNDIKNKTENIYASIMDRFPFIINEAWETDFIDEYKEKNIAAQFAADKNTLSPEKLLPKIKTEADRLTTDYLNLFLKSDYTTLNEAVNNLCNAYEKSKDETYLIKICEFLHAEAAKEGYRLADEYQDWVIRCYPEYFNLFHNQKLTEDDTYLCYSMDLLNCMYYKNANTYERINWLYRLCDESPNIQVKIKILFDQIIRMNEAYTQSQISKDDANRYLEYCSNATDEYMKDLNKNSEDINDYNLILYEMSVYLENKEFQDKYYRTVCDQYGEENAKKLMDQKN
jgi:hypothetical protein